MIGELEDGFVPRTQSTVREQITYERIGVSQSASKAERSCQGGIIE